MAKPKAATKKKKTETLIPKRYFARRPRKTGITQVHTGLMLERTQREELERIAAAWYYGNMSMAARVVVGHGLHAFNVANGPPEQGEDAEGGEEAEGEEANGG